MLKTALVQLLHEHKILWPKHRFNAIEGLKKSKQIEVTEGLKP